MRTGFSGPLSGIGLDVSSKHDASLVTRELDVVIYSAAIPISNPERTQAEKLGIPQTSYVEALAQIASEHRSLAVAGTHGKSSTTAWITALVEAAGRSPTFACGAERTIDSRNGKLGQDGLAIVEACEYRNHFHHFSPQAICLLGIEPDHFDCFPSFNDMVASYASFIQQLPDDGALIFNKDCPVSVEVAASSPARTISFATEDQSAGWCCQQIGAEVQIYRSGKYARSFPFSLFGRHQLMNLSAAIATLEFFDIQLSLPEIARQISSPPKLKRRFEFIEKCDLGTVIDDYAHHPTEIRMTLAAVREQFPKSRIRCCFQPHQLTRTQNLYDEFLNALALSDSTFILPVYAAREQHTEESILISQRMAGDLRQLGHEAMFIGSLDQVWRTLETDANSQDILVTLGAGDITRIHNERTR